jgi:hypothetical protein
MFQRSLAAGAHHVASHAGNHDDPDGNEVEVIAPV